MSAPLLAGLRVIESSAFIAAPLCGLTLAQLGAEVVRVDLVGGGIDYRRMPVAASGRSFYWTGLNKEKRSIAIDFTRPEGRELLAALACAPGDGAGIFLTNIPTRWLSHAALAARRPDMITCTIEGNSDGSTAVDYTVNCATGYPAVTGPGSRAAGEPHASGLGRRLRAPGEHRDRGRGRQPPRRRRGAELRIALSDIAFAVLSNIGLIAEAEVAGTERASIGNDIYGAFGRDFPTEDGERVMVAAILLKQWRGLVAACAIAEPIASLEAALGVDFAREEQRFEHRHVIAALVERWVSQRALAAVAEPFDASGVCWGPYRTVSELIRDDPRVSAGNSLFDLIETPGIGAHRASRSPVRMAGAERGPVRPPPLLGAGTDSAPAEILRLTEQEIGSLHDRGIVAGLGKDPMQG